MDANEQAAMRIGKLLKQRRAARRLTLDQAAEEIGVSASTLSRWERRGSSDAAKLPRQFDVQTYQKISRWVDDKQPWVGSIGEQLLQPVHGNQDTPSTPEVIEAHLRADKNLDSENAELLIDLIKTAYSRWSREESGRAPRTEQE